MAELIIKKLVNDELDESDVYQFDELMKFEPSFYNKIN